LNVEAYGHHHPPPHPHPLQLLTIYAFLDVKHLPSAWEGDATNFHNCWVEVIARLYLCVQIFQQAAISSSTLPSPTIDLIIFNSE